MRLGICILVWAPFASPAFAAGDAARGAQVFQQCMACHSTQAGEHLTGPSLAHAYGAKAASAAGFMRYSDALKSSRLTWNHATLDRWLANPAELVPGTGMTFPGIKEPRAREDVIAYLKAVAEDKAPVAKGGGGMMMGMAPRRLNLKDAPPAGQVRSISHCGDTYTIETADGKREKIWEYNLRLKTDSSNFGPAAGKPVVVGAGMQGDRASIVFASPQEIGRAIREECP